MRSPAFGGRKKGLKIKHSKSNRKEGRSFDRDLYKERNLIERMFNKLKHFRRVATRYDKTAENLKCLCKKELEKRNKGVEMLKESPLEV